MFEQMLLPAGGTHQTRNATAVFAVQVLLVAFAIFIVPGLFVAQLPKLDVVSMLVAPPLPPPPPPPPAPPAARASAAVVPKFTPRLFVPPRIVAPQTIPQNTQIAQAPPSLDQGVIVGVVGGVPGGIAGGVLGGTSGGIIGALPPPAPAKTEAPPAAQAGTPSQIQVGGDVQAARLTHEVTPEYPPLARNAHISGTVTLSAAIAPDGTVKDLHVMSGNPLLVQSAMSAVKQWKYRPTYLNGKPVQVLTEVDVKFTLS